MKIAKIFSLLLALVGIGQARTVEAVEPIMIGAGGAAISEVAPEVISSVSQVPEAGGGEWVQVVVQIVVGICTLIRLFARKRKEPAE